MNAKSCKAGLLLASLLSLSLVAQGAANHNANPQGDSSQPGGSHKEAVKEPCCCDTLATVGSGSEESVISSGKQINLNNGGEPWQAQNVSSNRVEPGVVRPQLNAGRYDLASLGTGSEGSRASFLKGQAPVLQSENSWTVAGEQRTVVSSSSAGLLLKGSLSTKPWEVNGSGSSVSSSNEASLKGTSVTGEPDVSWRIVPSGSSRIQPGKSGNWDVSAARSGWLVVGSYTEKSAAESLASRPAVLHPAYRLDVVGSSQMRSPGVVGLKGEPINICDR